LNIATRKTKISPNFMMCGLSSVLILEWAGLLSQSCRVRAGLVFKRRRSPYLHAILLYKSLYTEVSEKILPRGDRRVLEDSHDNGDLIENMTSHKLDVSC
jgi:hypothetical protein